MTIYLASDHAGFALKEKIKQVLAQEKHEIVDCGSNSLVPDDDYPDFIAKAAELAAKNQEARAIIFGGSGQGEAMVANRHKGVRAVVWYGGNMDIVRLSREHNNANILSLGARFVTDDEAREAVTLWLKTPFSNDERHQRRLNKF